jgi:PAS domain-containing protein
MRLESALAELALAEEELQVCIEELNTAQEADADRLLPRVFMELPIAAFALNADGAILRTNAAGAELLGASQRHLSRRPLAGMIDLGVRASFRTALSRAARDAVTSSLRLRLTTRQGPREVVMTLRALSLESGRLVVAVAGEVASAAGEWERRLEAARSEIANLRRALASRTIIGQATGIVMAQRGIGAEEAFQVLTRASQNDNVKLALLAEGVVDHPDTAENL